MEPGLVPVPDTDQLKAGLSSRSHSPTEGWGSRTLPPNTVVVGSRPQDVARRVGRGRRVSPTTGSESLQAEWKRTKERPRSRWEGYQELAGLQSWSRRDSGYLRFVFVVSRPPCYVNTNQLHEKSFHEGIHDGYLRGRTKPSIYLQYSDCLH